MKLFIGIWIGFMIGIIFGAMWIGYKQAHKMEKGVPILAITGKYYKCVEVNNEDRN